MARPAFATPLPQSARSEVLEWRFPRPWHQYVLTGKSRAAWHTSFVIPQLNLLLDAGLCVNHLRPKHIFLTHGHSDHTLLIPAFVGGGEAPPDIFCPDEMKDAVDDFINAKTLLNLGGHITFEEARQRAAAKAAVSNGVGPEPSADGESDVDNGVDPDAEPPCTLNTHVTRGLHHGDAVPLSRVKGPPLVSATAFRCDHTVPCLGYLFGATTQKLRPEYAALAGRDVAELRRQGVAITAPRTVPIFAFLGDTTVATLAALAEGWRRGGEREGQGRGDTPDDDDGDIFACPPAVVITECSFLLEEHRAQAVKTKHTLWSDLEPVVRRWPATTFVITHFSLRYTDADVRHFFAELPDPPGNIVIWVDGEGGAGGKARS